MKMLRKITALVLTLLMVANIAFVNAIEVEPPSFEVVSTQGQQGTGGIEVPIRIKNNPGIASITLKISYDNERLELKKAAFNTWASSGVTGPINNNPTSLVWVQIGSDYSESDSIFATLTFDIRDNAPAGEAFIKLQYDPDDVYNADETNIDFAIQNGSINVLQAPIALVAAQLKEPVKGHELSQSIVCASGSYHGEVAWYEGSSTAGSPVSGLAKANQVYTAKITLIPTDGASFADYVDVTVNEDESQTIPVIDQCLVLTKTFPATAEKEIPVCETPADLMAIYGQTLADVQISNPAGNTPGTWTWMTPDTSVGDVASEPKMFQARFTPTDAMNYAEVENINVPVKVMAKTVNDPTITVTPATYEYTGEIIIPTTVTVTDGIDIIPSSEYSLDYSNNLNRGVATVTIQDVDGGNYILTGNLTKNFEITGKAGTIVFADPGIIVYDGDAVELGGGKDLQYSYVGDGAVSIKWYADNAGEHSTELGNL